jgi:hypothetical protein
MSRFVPYEEVLIRATGRLALVLRVDGDAVEVVVDGATGTRRLADGELAPTGVRLERSDVESPLEPSPWPAVRDPRGNDSLDVRLGADEVVTELAVALERLLEALEHEDLGRPWMATRRVSEWEIRVEADRWGFLVLARAALRLATDSKRDTAHFDVGSYLEEFDDVFALARVNTPPRWWWDEPLDDA